jgi:SNF2 family DNA or RNA helicase
MTTLDAMRVRLWEDLPAPKEEEPPKIDAQPEWIDMKPEEEELYHRIEEYIRDHYQKYEAERKGLGFIMTVYRKRLTSSFYAIEQSLERRLKYLKGSVGDWLTDEDVEQEDLEEDVSELLPFDETGQTKPQIPPLFLGEIEYVRDFIADLRALGTDSKFEQLTKALNDVLKRRDSVIVFTQYTDTMDYLRNKLCQVYGSQVACYSGRGGERWNGAEWFGTSKENIKTAFRESQDIKILLCTESASEGLNLQTCGVLINYEMPWNPMRLEQRIGRIDRIGQEYDRVWIRNYFDQGTVEATVYQRLDDRIASFESVVGELQPILSQVARVIEAATMANDKRRGEMIASAIEEINRKVQSAEISALDLDKLTDDEVAPAPEEPVPITMQELERTLAESKAIGERLRPHGKIPGAHLLDWHGHWREVTFDLKLFDEHPNTLTLLSYGSDLLHEVLDVVEQPHEAKDAGVVARCSLRQVAVGYYGPPIVAVTSLGQLEKALDSNPAVLFVLAQRGSLEHAFAESVRNRLRTEEKAADDRRKAQLSSLTEEIRQLLVEAAYIELSQATIRDLFDEVLPLDFSEQAYQRLKRHKVPFSGALKLVGAGLPKPRSDDSLFVRLRETKRDALVRRFDAVRGKLTDRLRDLMELRKRLEQAAHAGKMDESAEVRLIGLKNDGR